MSNLIDNYKSLFFDFIEKDFDDTTYHDKIVKLVRNAEKQSMVKDHVNTRLLIDLDHIRRFDSKLSSELLHGDETCAIVHSGFEIGFQEIVQREFGHLLQLDQDTLALSDHASIPSMTIDQFHVGFLGHFGSHVVSPRQLLSHFLNSMICVEGIVTKINISIPELMQSVHYCPKNSRFHKRKYRTETSVLGIATPMAFPTKDEEGNPLETEFGLCRYRDRQKLYLQEMPERAPAGQLPRSVQIDLEDDLVDLVKPGDRVRIIGMYHAVTKRSVGAIHTGAMETTVSANNIDKLDFQVQFPTPSEIAEFRRVSHNEDIVDLLSQSIAPSIFGHEIIKKALLLQLLGGVEKNLKHGTHLRGDINILLVGDPGTAKSQLLRYMLHLSPLSISTSGRSSTGVGLTAAVVSDPQTGERTLQAGAMVLADRGLVCVDEFDKMLDEDRTAMHEVMEQQTVTIQKAGIHTTLNARTSVLAASNPIYGHYEPRKSVQHNVNLPDSLLSRFDLVFVLVDSKDQFRDRSIATHVLKMHQYKDDKLSTKGLSDDTKANEFGSISMSSGFEDNSNKDAVFTTTVFGQKLYTREFLRKFVSYAKKRTPKMLPEAMALIQEKYVYLRSGASRQVTLPITARSLETLIRLSTAHAKCRLSNEITIKDVEGAFEIMEYAICFGSRNPKQDNQFLGDVPDNSTLPSDDSDSDSESDGDNNEQLNEFDSNKEEIIDNNDNNTNKPEISSTFNESEDEDSNSDDKSITSESRKRSRESDDSQRKTKQLKLLDDSTVNIAKFILSEMVLNGKLGIGYVELATLLEECKPYKSSITLEELIKYCEDGSLGNEYMYDNESQRLYTNAL